MVKSFRNFAYVSNLHLTLSWWRLLWYRNQSTDLLCKKMDWFLYDNGLRHERVKKKRFSNIFKTTNVTNFTKAILKSSYRVQKVAFKYKTLKQPVYVLKAVKFCCTFWHSNWHNFGHILGKIAKPHFLESPDKSARAVEHVIF